MSMNSERKQNTMDVGEVEVKRKIAGMLWDFLETPSGDTGSGIVNPDTSSNTPKSPLRNDNHKSESQASQSAGTVDSEADTGSSSSPTPPASFRARRQVLRCRKNTASAAKSAPSSPRTASATATFFSHVEPSKIRGSAGASDEKVHEETEALIESIASSLYTLLQDTGGASTSKEIPAANAAKSGTSPGVLPDPLSFLSSLSNSLSGSLPSAKSFVDSSFPKTNNFFLLPSVSRTLVALGAKGDNADDGSTTTDKQGATKPDLMDSLHACVPIVPMLCYPLLGKWLALAKVGGGAAGAAGSLGFPSMAMSPAAVAPPMDEIRRDRENSCDQSGEDHEVAENTEPGAENAGLSGEGSNFAAGVGAGGNNNHINPNANNPGGYNPEIHANNPQANAYANAPLAPAPETPPETPSLFSILFPKFNPDTFLGRVCIFQLVEYFGSICLSMGSGMTDNYLGMASQGSQFTLSPNTCSLYLLGASWGPAIAGGQFWRLISPMMLHANGLHIFFNLFFQCRVGFSVEQDLGPKRFMMLYMFCGFFGNLISVLVDPYKLAVGASTSAFGLLGSWLSEIHLSWHLISPETKKRLSGWFAGMLFALIMMTFIAPNIDLYGHVGGLFGGYLLSLIMSDVRPQHRPAWYDQGQSWAKIFLSWFVGLGTAKVLFMNPSLPLPECGTLLHPRSMMY